MKDRLCACRFQTGRGHRPALTALRCSGYAAVDQRRYILGYIGLHSAASRENL